MGCFFSNPMTFLSETIWDFNDYISIILFSILLIVLINLISVFVRSFNLDYYEDHRLENFWTITPFLIITVLAIPSVFLLYGNDRCSFCGLSFRAIGHQWYWQYASEEAKECSFDSYIIPDSSMFRLIDTDNRLILPSDIPVRALITSSDVIHSWTVPRFGVKVDAIPGRISQTCFSVKFRGVSFGQCSEICGINHRFIPIVVESVPLRDYFSL